MPFANRSTSGTATPKAIGPSWQGAAVRSGPLQHLQLMAQREDLEVQIGTLARYIRGVWPLFHA